MPQTPDPTRGTMWAVDRSALGDVRTVTIIVDWEGPDDSNAWKGVLARAVAAGVAREQREMPGWQPAHPLDSEWLSANGHTWWAERSSPPAGSPFVKTLHYATVDFRPASRHTLVESDQGSSTHPES